MTIHSECEEHHSPLLHGDDEILKIGKKSIHLPRKVSVWRDQFAEDRCCERNKVPTEIFWAAIPHVLLNLLIILYLVVGAQLFQQFDEDLADNDFSTLFLFSFTTLTTIGWGDICPTTTTGKVVYLVYAVIGIPFIFLVLASDGRFINEMYSMLKTCSTEKVESMKEELPLWVTGALLLSHCLLGTVIFGYWIDSMPFVDAFYFCFISIATIGFGDLTPSPENHAQHYIIVIYMAIGIIFLSTLTSSLSGYLRVIHHFGRPVWNTGGDEIWLGGDSLRVDQLTRIIAKHFGVSGERLHNVICDLDDILRVATQHTCEAQSQLLERTAEFIYSESFVVSEERKTRCLLVGRNQSPRRIPMNFPLQRGMTSLSMTSINGAAARVSSPVIPLTEVSPHLQKDVDKTTVAALYALGALHHHIRKSQRGRNKAEVV